MVKNLTWEDTFAIFGRSDIARLRAHYHNSGLRDELSEKSQKFWDKRLRKDFNFMYSGTSGLAAWGLVHLVLPVLGLGFIRRLVMKGVSKVKPVLEDPVERRARLSLQQHPCMLQLRDILINLYAGVDSVMTFAFSPLCYSVVFMSYCYFDHITGIIEGRSKDSFCGWSPPKGATKSFYAPLPICSNSGLWNLCKYLV